MPQLTYTEKLETTTCWCGIHLAVPANLLRHAKDDSSNSIYCPLGHKFYFGETNKERLEEETRRRQEAERRARATRELLAAEERSHSATRGHLTRQKRRVSAGVCPVEGCHRHFQNLDRHMQSKHPEFVAEQRA